MAIPSATIDRFILGCGNFGGIGSAPAFFGQGERLDEALALMDAAWALGIRRFDTADAYGGGRSEQAIGEWIARTGNRPRVTTKTFNPMHELADSGLGSARVARQLASSLARLRLESVELFLAHEFDPHTPLDESTAAFESAQSAGLIRAYGVSNYNGTQLAAAVAAGRPRAIQNSYSLLDRAAEREVLPLCAQHGIEFQAFSPLAGGWLTGKYRRDDVPPPQGSRMSLRPEPYLHLRNEHVYAALDTLEAVAARHQVSAAGVALAWLVAQPLVGGIVVGPRRPEHLEPIREALALELDAADIALLNEAFPSSLTAA